jgi:hypothetical protein
LAASQFRANVDVIYISLDEKNCQGWSEPMLEVEVIDDPGAAAVGLDPISSFWSLRPDDGLWKNNLTIMSLPELCSKSAHSVGWFGGKDGMGDYFFHSP